jgi:hypothetical protein
MYLSVGPKDRTLEVHLWLVVLDFRMNNKAVDM